MADHVTVDLARVEALAAGLQRVSESLRTADAATGQGCEVFGTAGLAAVMDEVAGNWRVHREQLSDSVGAHQKLVRAAVEGYRALDRGLGDAFTAPSVSSGADGAGPQ